MKHLKKIVSILMVSTLLLSLLAGCRSEPEFDPVQEVMGYSKDTVLFTLNGDKVVAEDYLFWLARYVDYINGMYMSMGSAGVEWDEDMGEGSTAREYFKTETMETVKISWAIEQFAADEGFAFTDEDKALYEEDRTAAIESSGGQEAYDLYLKSMCLTDEGMERANRTSILYNKMFEAFCQPGGRLAGTREDIQNYMEDAGILKAKHILLLTKDPDTNEAYSEETIAAQRVIAEDLLSQIRASEEPLALFDQLMKEHSEDSGLQTNPDGYTFTPGQMVEEFENGARALDYNAISDIVESAFGYHIILRLDPTEDQAVFQQYQTEWQSTQMDQLLQEKMDSVEVKTTELYDALDVQDFHEKLTAFRDKLEEEAAAKAGDDATAPEEDDTGTPEGDNPENPDESGE